MAIRGDYDPTDLGLLSDADHEALQRRRARSAGESSRTIGPATPATDEGWRERAQRNVAAIYQQMGWTRPGLTPEEEQARDERRRRRELQRRG